MMVFSLYIKDDALVLACRQDGLVRAADRRSPLTNFQRALADGVLTTLLGAQDDRHRRFVVSR
ncbi:hypothetical protein [Allosphingosinicella deserti]|uniref:Uncharacterized protein n=1 Tax=Allosphingosinicella deserti TaxID=2116704 RepID=A0A2P7QHD9_9SPHN|nr:hypothetical protein [Sphingomonas deserti]PSJ37389.1 hypothetical protein C7I55_23015 [Sphingomonas deserti]